MLKYQIALTNAIFDDTYRNVLRFNTRAEQEAYFNVNTLFANDPDLKCNFHVGALYATSVVVDVNTDDLNEELNYNYCIVKDTTAGATLKYYYYFVKKAQQDNANRLVCDLELDVYQTYYIDLTFGDCAIIRAHLNRFVDNGDNTVSFDATPQSKLFEREQITDVPKRLVKRDKLTLAPNNTYYNENILCWLYLYLDPTHDFNFYTPNGTAVTRKPNRIAVAGDLPTNIGCLAVPIYTQRYIFPPYPDPRITINDSDTGSTMSVKLGGTSFLKEFENLNNGYAYVYSAKLSLLPPSKDFANITQTRTMSFGGGNDLLFSPSELGNGRIVSLYSNGQSDCAILLNEQTSINIDWEEQTIDKKFTFNKTDIVGADADVKFNPKLNNNDYYELNIVDTAGNSFTYDMQKFNTNKIKLRMTEPLTPDFTKNYSRLVPPANNTLYIQDTTQNLLGLVTSNDNTIVLPTSAYQNMIANNKNYYVQNSFNRGITLGKNLLSVGTNAGSGNYVGAGIQLLNSGIDYAQSVANQKFEVDNLRNAPAAIEAANGNFIFGSLYTNPGIYIEQYDIIDNNKKAVNDYLMLYGFSYNRIDNIKNVDNIRKNYNYVQAYVEEINTGLVNISNIVHNKIREIFAKGIRMWNLQQFTYEKENYERWLEE